MFGHRGALSFAVGCLTVGRMSGSLPPTTRYVGEIPTRFLTARRRKELFPEFIVERLKEKNLKKIDQFLVGF